MVLELLLPTATSFKPRLNTSGWDSWVWESSACSHTSQILSCFGAPCQHPQFPSISSVSPLPEKDTSEIILFPAAEIFLLKLNLLLVP